MLKVPVVKMCMAPGCSQYGSHGFQFGRILLCGPHSKDHEKYSAQVERDLAEARAAGEGERQGRLL